MSESSASSIRSVMTSTGVPASKSYSNQLLLSPAFLTCAGAVLFRGIPPPASLAYPWSPPSPPSLSSSSRGTSPSWRAQHLPNLTTDRLEDAGPTFDEAPINIHSMTNTSVAPFPSAVATAAAAAAGTTCTNPTSSSSLSALEAAPALEVCVIYHERKKEYILAKGRKDQFESGLLETAMRETYEETGFPCRPFPVGMITRAPLPGADVKDIKEGTPVSNSIEPFALTIRTIASDNIKIIYWFIAEASSNFAVEGTRMPSESAFSSHWFSPEEALRMLTHQHDREVVRRAIELVRAEIVMRSSPSSARSAASCAPPYPSKQ